MLKRSSIGNFILVLFLIALQPCLEASCRKKCCTLNLAGGGTFIRNKNARLNTVFSLAIQGIDVRRINEQQSVTGTLLSSTPVQEFGGLTETTVFLTMAEVDSILLLSFNKKTGDYEMIVKGHKIQTYVDSTFTDNIIEFVNRPTGIPPGAPFFTGEVVVTGDEIIGRLRRKNGVVTRSDWTTGYENCVGFGQPSLTINGVSIQTGDNSIGLYTSSLEAV